MLALALGGVASPGAHAEERAGEARDAEGPARGLEIPSSGDQPALAVVSDPSGRWRAVSCVTLPCEAQGGVVFGPRGSSARRGTALAFTAVNIGRGRRVVTALRAASSGEEGWASVVAAVPGEREPRVLFDGPTGFTSGEPGSRVGAVVKVSERNAEGAENVLVGELHEELDLCGREALLAPRLVDPNTLTLRPARVQRLSIAERERATALRADGSAASEPVASGNALRARAASSALGSPRALTDGDANTTWSEARGGDGRGEFVTFAIPEGLPLTALELWAAPAQGTGPAEARLSAPDRLWIASRGELFRLDLRWPNERLEAASAGARLRVELPRPIASDCLALVLDHARRDVPGMHVGLAEVVGRTPFDGEPNDALAARLDGADAATARAVLGTRGAAAAEALTRAFPNLGETGRRHALELLDGAGCESAAFAYVSALQGAHPAERDHAQVRLLRCGAAAAPALTQALATARGERFAQLAALLADAAPERALDALVPLLGRGSRARQRELRTWVARAARRGDARATVRAHFARGSDAETPHSALVRFELARALGDQVGAFSDEATRAVRDALSEKPSFRRRYLAAEIVPLIAREQAPARALEAELRSAIEPEVRARLAASTPGDERGRADLARLTRDPAARVREAALARLLELGPPTPSEVELRSLAAQDAYPFVRRGALALLAARADASAVRALRSALEDPVWSVRSAAAESLAEVGARDASAELRRRLRDRREHPWVRRSAALALGRLCDTQSARLLTREARQFLEPRDAATLRFVAPAALDALLRLNPPDLAERLEPLQGALVPPPVRARVAAGLLRRQTCRVNGEPPSR
jgi:HEAT repeat protein